jgi:predicted HNH restriction endonuclease
MKYASNKEQQFIQNRRRIAKWFLGEECGWRGKNRQISVYLRNYLLEINNYSCELCGWNKRHPIDNKPLVEIDHIDGDAENNRPDNLIVLCPNCHAQTPTFRARNKSSKRQRL